MKWQCSYYDYQGERCGNEAIYRLHFADDHPFDHIDVCRKHIEEYQSFCWTQDLDDKGEFIK